MKMPCLLVLFAFIFYCLNGQDSLKIKGIFRIPYFGLFNPIADLDYFNISDSDGLLRNGIFSRVRKANILTELDTIFLSPRYNGPLILRDENGSHAISNFQIRVPANFNSRIPFGATYPVETCRYWKRVGQVGDLRYADYELSMTCIPLCSEKIKFINLRARNQNERFDERNTMLMVIVKIDSIQPIILRYSSK